MRRFRRFNLKQYRESVVILFSIVLAVMIIALAVGWFGGKYWM